MTKGTTRLLRTSGALALVLAALWVGWDAFRPAAPGLRQELEATADPSRNDLVPEIVIVAANGALRPNVVYSRAGQPLRILVRATPGGGGPDRLLVPDLGVAADLAPDGETIVAVPVAPRGVFRITDRGGTAIGALRFQ